MRCNMDTDLYRPGFRKILLLKIMRARPHMVADRFTAHDFIYHGMFRFSNEIESYIRDTEMTESIVSKSAAPGIDIYAVGDIPDYYIAFDITKVPPVPTMIARLGVSYGI